AYPVRGTQNRRVRGQARAVPRHATGRPRPGIEGGHITPEDTRLLLTRPTSRARLKGGLIPALFHSMFDQKAYNKQYYLDNAEALKAKARERQRAKPRVRPLLTPEQRVERARVVSRINIGVHPDHVTGEAKSGPCEICKTDTSLHFDHD